MLWLDLRGGAENLFDFEGGRDVVKADVDACRIVVVHRKQNLGK